MGRPIDLGKRREWADRLARRESSGLTVAEFCEWEGVSMAAFYQWRKKLRGETACRPTPKQRPSAICDDGGVRKMPLTSTSAFLPVQLTPAKTVRDSRRPPQALAELPPVEIQLPNGVSIVVPISEISSLRDVLLAASDLFSPQETVRC